MINRWSFHAPHDPEKVVINEEENKYFSWRNTFRLSNAKTFELVERDIQDYFDEETKNNSLQVPDLVLSTDFSEKVLSADLSDEDEEDVPIRQERVFYRKPSKYVRPKLSLVEEEDDEDIRTAVTSIRSSFRDSMVVHEEFDSE